MWHTNTPFSCPPIKWWGEIKRAPTCVHLWLSFLIMFMSTLWRLPATSTVTLPGRRLLLPLLATTTVAAAATIDGYSCHYYRCCSCYYCCHLYCQYYYYFSSAPATCTLASLTLLLKSGNTGLINLSGHYRFNSYPWCFFFSFFRLFFFL